MGISFYTCANCRRNFPDCGNYFNCYSCGENFCSNECGGRQIEEETEDGYEEITSCILCRLESVTDADMVQFLLKKLDLTHAQAVAMFRKESEADDE